ncbi:ArsR/SmtB family transcription factor [Promicromonospora thailandica]|uniref:DNA-binding transcriptional regulator, ArsR family n=1 Tax=Promicromonospora thailandica TaxID=765201 RepID=A0A9X2JW29_9MICO|nr:ArsR family transcriptional regulator [Promicromonospora thailandica]MCP2265112.1 DNA-binding transcriptional regulator, ArsR family [Promicromonospora thailandica]
MTEFPSADMAQVELVDVLRALADPVRLQIVGMLADGKPYPKGDCTMGLDLTKSTASYHFRTLRESGLTRTIVHGRTHDIQLRRDELDEKFPGLIEAVLREK